MTEAKAVVRDFEANFLRDRGELAPVVRPLLRRIIKTCDAFVAAFEPNTSDRPRKSSAPLGKSKRRIDLASFAEVHFTGNELLNQANVAINAVRQLESFAHAVQDTLRQRGGFKTAATEDLIRTLADIWQADKNGKPSMTRDGPFQNFVESAFEGSSLVIPKERLESALKGRAD